MVAGAEHAQGREERNAGRCRAVEASQDEHGPAGDDLQAPRRNTEAGPSCEREGGGLPADDVGLVVPVGKLGQREVAVAVPDRGLGPGSTEGGPGGEQQTEILVAVGVADDVFGGREQPREFDQGRYAGGLRSRQKGTAFRFREAERALAGLVIDPEQVVDLVQGARCLTGARGAPAFRPAHEHPPPAVGRRIAQGAEQRIPSRRVKGAGSQGESRFEREAAWMREPTRVVLEGGALPALALACPQPAGRHGDAVEVDMNDDLSVHHSPCLPPSVPGAGLRGPRMRCGRRSSSSARPSSSVPDRPGRPGVRRVPERRRPWHRRPGKRPARPSRPCSRSCG